MYFKGLILNPLIIFINITTIKTKKKFYDLNFVIDPFDISRMYIPSSKSINSTSTKELSILIKRILKKIKIN